MKKLPHLLLALALAGLTLGCTSNQKAGAAKGGTRGAVAGAAAGVVGALIFGDDVGDAAARGAVWAGTAGAVSGAMAGTDADRREAEQERKQAEKKLRELRKRIGEDAFNGLAALADCKHEVALAYASTAARSENAAYAEAAIWLRAMTYVETGQEGQAAELYPELVEKDEHAKDVDDVRERVMHALETVRDYREKEGRPRFCP